MCKLYAFQSAFYAQCKSPSLSRRTLWPSTLILIPRQLLKLSVRVTLFYWSFVKQSSIVELQGYAKCGFGHGQRISGLLQHFPAKSCFGLFRDGWHIAVSCGHAERFNIHTSRDVSDMYTAHRGRWSHIYAAGHYDHRICNEPFSRASSVPLCGWRIFAACAGGLASSASGSA